jgi:hypothetical protein
MIWSVTARFDVSEAEVWRRRVDLNAVGSGLKRPHAELFQRAEGEIQRRHREPDRGHVLELREGLDFLGDQVTNCLPTLFG